MKAPGRLVLIILCSVVFSAVYILLCCWAGLPLCLATCLDHFPTGSRPTVPGPLHFSGYSSVPDGKPLVREPCRSCAVVSSSGQMLGSGLGAEIDSAECVFRMNQAPTVGFEADVGQRSTLRVISHTSVPLLLRNYSHYFQKARDTLYVVWGQGRHMDRVLGGRTYRTLLQLTRMYPGLQVYTFTEHMMAYCDQIFQDETGKNRPVPHPAGRRATPQCLTTTSRRAGWMNVRCTWHTSRRPEAPTASSLRRRSSPAGPRRGPSCSPIRPGGLSSLRRPASRHAVARPPGCPIPSHHTPQKHLIYGSCLLPCAGWT
ncbi:alpha-N-acetyl-neuraminyl-2,3-beta-galactosyl-1,3-N-acetyl-galactosaminide alpha-2,6-sialyltransferase isoform X3 [Pongo abelii]|uniref:alpha-N-acetyl-neuraminyl-2,3-beta-galactosyl-1, 3-N-acetyl-galactosaminide alpha-2,6-sialyltransferase isoform X3 n=1 Tax=Pongo abelii TaxID=9601 RepID=UPI003006D242